MTSPPPMPEATPSKGTRPVSAVLAVLQRPGDGHFLLVRRAKEPDRGLWGFPGGKIESGETFADAAIRELREETGAEATATGLLSAFDSIHLTESGDVQFHYVVLVITCTPVPDSSATIRAADDALEAAWFSLGQIRQLGNKASIRLAALADKADRSRHTDQAGLLALYPPVL
ncbi:NUDIX hydrolase [Acetobacter sp. AN02]|uniref:NUDIX hydrolase n=1 Tax=Acetobacter sp. AN02 TaxID=2894186 RepID=UPI0024343C17|nr:NUDIX hydrolase [Acetobacter sp. AN02]MDG6094629.1 NUDIX hydrolase [Acetobacter sp. AN02]